MNINIYEDIQRKGRVRRGREGGRERENKVVKFKVCFRMKFQ